MTTVMVALGMLPLFTQSMTGWGKLYWLRTQVSEMIDRYIHFYNHKRIQLKSGVSPLALRHST